MSASQSSRSRSHSRNSSRSHSRSSSHSRSRSHSRSPVSHEISRSGNDLRFDVEELTDLEKECHTEQLQIYIILFAKGQPQTLQKKFLSITHGWKYVAEKHSLMFIKKSRPAMAEKDFEYFRKKCKGDGMLLMLKGYQYHLDETEDENDDLIEEQKEGAFQSIGSMVVNQAQIITNRVSVQHHQIEDDYQYALLLDQKEKQNASSVASSAIISQSGIETQLSSQRKQVADEKMKDTDADFLDCENELTDFSI
jgi:hypothetical protein